MQQTTPSKIPTPCTSSRIPRPQSALASPVSRRAVETPSRLGSNVPSSPARRVVNSVPLNRPAQRSEKSKNVLAAAQVQRSQSPTPSTKRTSVMPRASIRTTEPRKTAEPTGLPQSPTRLRSSASYSHLRAHSPRTPSKLVPTDKVRSDSPCRETTPTLRGPKITAGPSLHDSPQIIKPATPNRPSIRDQIAAKRRELRNAEVESQHPTPCRGSNPIQHKQDEPSHDDADTFSTTTSRPDTVIDTEEANPFGQVSTKSHGDDFFGRSLKDLVTKAIRSGKLNVPSMGLEHLPRELWTRILRLSDDELDPELKASNVDSLSRAAAESPFASRSLLRPAASQEADSDSPAKFPKRQDLNVEEVPFYEIEELVAIRASGNLLKTIENQIGMFGALKTLDVSFFREIVLGLQTNDTNACT